MPIEKKTPGKVEPEFKEPDSNPDDAITPVVTPGDDDDDWNPADYVYVTLPNGKVRAVHKSDVDNANNDATLPAPPPKRQKETEHYLHLANGDHVRVKASDIPAAAGSNHPNGFYIQDGHAHYVVGVYPAETAHIEPEDD